MSAWKVWLLVQNSDGSTSAIRPVNSQLTRTKSAAIEHAGWWCRRQGNSANIYDTKGKLRYHYWHDGTLQYIAY